MISGATHQVNSSNVVHHPMKPHYTRETMEEIIKKVHSLNSPIFGKL